MISFFLTIDAETEKIFTVPPADYNHSTYACEKTATGVAGYQPAARVDILSLPYPIPVNLGEPSIEKIFMGDDDVPNSKWQFQID